jgi:tRNA (guanosine-2'-O-)-methyltransferase
VQPQGKPITERRLARMRGTLARRQPDLAVVMENIHDAHNVSAMLRSCDAVGAATAHLVYTVEEAPEIAGGVAASAQRWLDLRRHDTIEGCYDELRRQGIRIYATTLGDYSHDLYSLDLTRPAAFVFGNETRGISPAAAAGADATTFIPMMGMVESLNVSVACAVALYEALRQRAAAGCYQRQAWGADEINRRLRAWLAREGRDLSAADSVSDLPAPRARNRHEMR